MSKHLSKIILLLGFAGLVALRLLSLSNNELSWDVFGYYLYLPATFIHHDPLLNDISWIHDVMKQLPVSGTLYQLSSNDEGGQMYFFLMGMAITYLPFFLLGHIIALVSGYPADGFSLPYQYTIALGALCYTLAALIFLRKILKHFFSDGIAALVILIIIAGTNYINYAAYKNLETTNVLFMLLTINIWFTIRWSEEYRFRHLLFAGLACTLSVLVKPSEAFCILIPLLWGVRNRAGLIARMKTFYARRKQLITVVLICLLLLLPQMIYWKISTGYFIYDSYKNPGVGLDLASPHIYKSLFSFRKGWLLYTPVMLFAMTGFILLYRKKREIFWTAAIYTTVSFYIISSWTEWWYGAAYGNRPMITSYALLAIPLGFSLQWISGRRVLIKAALFCGIGLLIILNLFQYWQYRNYILDPYRTTRAYYFAVFGRTSLKPEYQHLLLPGRSFGGGPEQLTNEQNYNMRNIGFYDFEVPDSNLIASWEYDTASGNHYFRLDSNVSFSPSVINTYGGLTHMNPAWIRASADIYIPADYEGELPCLVVTFARKEGLYGYRTVCADATSERGQWITLSMDYMTPEIRDVRDRFQSYIWHRGTGAVYVDNFKVNVFDPKW